ncbi:hypothetical protein L9F63_009176 [Diploptera punctata]|uniref:Uncharacterized protein n=1 Tax=Diploptera punctata TaxID=6984 RepID=A0AAD8E0S5_DIPPU|nr:hypothetical protein L9F63_009176 [Diploptera punctata]
MSRRRLPPNHHRKRVASESRHHGVNNDDSHMFIIKLPPNPYYYSHNKPLKTSSSYNSVNKVPVSFRANGKPARVYHWNIPIYNIQKTSPWSDRQTNEVHQVMPKAAKQTRKSNDNQKASVSYYTPVTQRKTIQKYFSGNGKPHSFYVIEKSKKPAYYQTLLP